MFPSYLLEQSSVGYFLTFFLNSIQFFSQIFQKKERKDNFVYQDEIKEDALNLNKKRVQKNISETIYQIQALNLIQSSEIISIIEQIGKIASETLDKHNSNFNENYLFIQEAVLNYLPTFTNDFVKGYKITKNTAFLVEYSTQIGLLYEKMIEKFNLLNDITDDALLEKMKQNTKFLQAKN